MIYLEFVVSLFLGISKNLVSKAGNREFSGIGRLMSVNIITALTAVCIFGCQGFSFEVMNDMRFVVMSVFYGLTAMAAQTFFIVGVKKGPVSVCSMIYAYCFVIPTIIIALYFHEEIKPTWIVGMVLMIISVFFVMKKGTTTQSGKKTYLVFAILAMCFAGSMGLLQKFFGHFYTKDLYDEFLVLSFLFVLVFSLVVKLLFRQPKEEREKATARFFVLGILLALSNVIANKLNLHLITVLPSVFFLPTINGATILFSAVFSHIFFKDRVTTIGWFGILVGIGALVMIVL